MQPLWFICHLYRKFDLYSYLFMRKTAFIFLLIVSCLTAGAQGNMATEDALQIREMSFDFGKIPQGKPVYHVFEITNTGKDPVG